MWLGILLILIGVSIVVNMVFGIHLPIFRTLIALFVIYIGLKMLFGERWFRMNWDDGGSENAAVFSSRRFTYAGEATDGFNTAFGSSVINIEKAPQSNQTLNVNTAFGNTIIRIRREVPVTLEVRSFLASGTLPDGTMAVIGKLSQNSGATSGEIPKLKLEINVAFGSAHVEFVD